MADIWKYLVSSDLADDADIIMRVTFLPVQNKYQATRFIYQISTNTVYW